MDLKRVSHIRTLVQIGTLIASCGILSYTDKDRKPWFETTGMSGMYLSHDRFCEMFIKLEGHSKVKVIKGHLKSIDLEVS